MTKHPLISGEIISPISKICVTSRGKPGPRECPSCSARTRSPAWSQASCSLSDTVLMNVLTLQRSRTDATCLVPVTALARTAYISRQEYLALMNSLLFSSFPGKKNHPLCTGKNNSRAPWKCLQPRVMHFTCSHNETAACTHGGLPSPAASIFI